MSIINEACMKGLLPKCTTLKYIHTHILTKYRYILYQVVDFEAECSNIYNLGGGIIHEMFLVPI